MKIEDFFNDLPVAALILVAFVIILLVVSLIATNKTAITNLSLPDDMCYDNGFPVIYHLENGKISYLNTSGEVVIREAGTVETRAKSKYGCPGQ